MLNQEVERKGIFNYPPLSLLPETEVLKAGGVDLVFRLPPARENFNKALDEQFNVLQVMTELVEKSGEGIDNFFLLYPYMDFTGLGSSKDIPETQVEMLGKILGWNFFYEGSPLKGIKQQGRYHRIAYSPYWIDDCFLRDAGLISRPLNGNMFAFGMTIPLPQAKEIAEGLGLKPEEYRGIPLQGGAFITTPKHVLTFQGTIQDIIVGLKYSLGKNLSYQEAKDLLKKIFTNNRRTFSKS